jgi:hypothetical protein
MSIDVRYRVDGDEQAPPDPASFFAETLPAALDAATPLFGPALDWLALVPLTIEVDGEPWQLQASDHVVVSPGRADGGATVRLTAEQLGELVSDQATFMGFFTWGTLDQPRGRLEHLLDWWLVLRAALDARPVYVPDTMTFTGPEGGPFDLGRSFRPDDDPAEMQHFLQEAGFLHLRGVFDLAEMDELSREMDRHADNYAPDDGQSWWAKTAGGEQRLVRLQTFERYSELAAALLEDERLLRIGALPGDEHEPRGSCQALVKPIGVVEGISDVPWHKDCSLGRHSYDCSGMTVGVSVTGAGATSGQLRVTAGTHRGLVWPAFSRKGLGLPEIDLATETGDVTVHLSCTTHMSQPPVERERRVLYTGFSLPPTDPKAVAAARQRLYRIMQSIPEGVSQKPATVGA